MSRKSLIVLLSLLFGLTIFSLMISSFDRTDSDAVEQSSSAGVLEVFAENVRTVRFDTAGEIDQIFTAAQLTQYQAETHTTISSPKLEIFKDTMPTWSISANQGRYNQDSIIQLAKNVKAEQLSSNQHIVILTSLLEINELTRIVYTDQPVIMTAKSGILNATGMTFNMNAETIQFNADVNAIYEPGHE